MDGERERKSGSQLKRQLQLSRCEARQDRPENDKTGLDVRRAVENDSPMVVRKHSQPCWPTGCGWREKETRDEVSSASLEMSW